MNMEVKDYILKQPTARQNVLAKIHAIILEADKTVKAEVEPMMGKEMIVYKGRGSMKYALASVKNYMSLHVLPIYGSNTLHSKYEALLPNASFQKGCINFVNEDDMPLDIIKQLMIDCSSIDLLKIREEYLKSKKIKK
jgi:hypothetical protein